MKAKLFFRYVWNYESSFLSILLFAQSTIIYAGLPVPARPAGSNNPALESQARQWLEQKNASAFLENRGQMMDMEGKPVSFVLFKTEAPGLNLWLTEKGITLQTLKIVEEKEKEKEGEKSFGQPEQEKIEIYWERIDIELEGATIKKENIFKEGVGNKAQKDINFRQFIV